MKPRCAVLLLALLIPLPSHAADGLDDASRKVFLELFDWSQKNNRSVTLLVNGQTLSGIVTRVTEAGVELKTRQAERAYVRLPRIDAVSQ